MTRPFSASAPARARDGLLRHARPFVALALFASLAGCSSLSSWIPSIPAPSFGWLWGGKKIPPLPEIKATVTPRVAWQYAIGTGAPGLAPAVTKTAIYAAASDGAIVRIDPQTGRTVWQIKAPSRLSAGVGADAELIAVGTSKGDVYAFDANGKALWQAKVSSEVISPPVIAEGLVVVFAGDGKAYGLTAGDGKTKWVLQRNNPPLIVRNTAGGVASRGGVFIGTPGGKLLAIDINNGAVAWEGNVATPRGATELERIVDVTSLPAIEERAACAVAYQGRIACFDLLRGTPVWTRDISSLGGFIGDNRYFYVTDDAGAVHALDKSTGGSVWKQDKLGPRQPTGPQLVGDYVAVVDIQGYATLFDRNDGSMVGRIATDGSPATSQPAAAGPYAVWQSTNGTLYAIGAP
jgi:outer membrane protein assembly factor BamB